MKDRPQPRRDGETSSAKPKVFVSYADEDSRFVNRLAGDLKRDFKVWDYRELGLMLGGDRIREVIAQAIDDAEIFLVVVSRHTGKSNWVESELDYAVDRRNDPDYGRPRIIEIRRGNATLPKDLGLKGKHYVQFGRGRSYRRSYEELLGALHEQPPLEGRKPRRSWIAVAAGAVALLGVGIGQILKSEDLPTIAVASFENKSNRAEDAWIATALGDMLTVALRSGGGARVVDREEVVKAERDFALAGITPTAADFRRRLGADYVVLGTYDRPPPDYAPSALAVSWRPAETAAREDSRPSPKNGSLAALADLVSDLAGAVGDRLHLPHDSSRQKTELQALFALFPRSPKGQELYFSGVTSYRAFDTSTAYDRLNAARAQEPDQPLVYRRLASVAWDLLREDEARGFARKARELAARLPEALRRERLEIERVEAEMAGRDSEVLSRYAELQAIRPKDDAYALALASAQESAGSGNDALGVFLAKRPASPKYLRARAWYRKANLKDNLGQRQEALELLDRAIANAEAAESTYDLAQARFLRSYILSRLGDYRAAEADLDAAQRTFSQAKDRLYFWVCEEQRAVLQYFQSKRPLPAILKDLQRLETKYRSSDEAGLGRVLVLESMVLSEQGRSEDADAKLKEAETLSALDANFLASTRIERAHSLILAGNMKEAAKQVEQVMAMHGMDPSKTATALTDLAESLYENGKLGEAKRFQTLALQSHTGRLATYDQLRLGLILAAQGEAEGRKQVQAAYDQQMGMTDHADAAEAALGLARLANLAGDFSQAADLAENAEKKWLAPAGRSGLVARAQASRAWSLTCEGDTAEAGKALGEAERRAWVSKDFHVRFETAIAGARWRAFSHTPGTDPLRDLETTARDARERGLRLYELDARLALGEVKLALGKGGRPELELLAREAAGSGFGQIAGLASRALKEGPVCKGRPPTFWQRLSRWLG
jgi:tetratricopeptide (TPR) repeat protein